MIKKLIKSVKQYKKDAILTPVFVGIEVILEVIIPLLMANLIDDGVYNGNMNMVYKIGIELVFCAILSLLFGMFSGISAAKASAGFMIIRIAVRSPLMLFSSLFFAISISPKLSLIFLILIPIIGLGLYLIVTHTHPIMERIFKTYDKLNNVVEENVSAIRVVKSFVLEDEENKKFNKVSNTIYQDFSKAEKLLALNSPLMQFAIYLCIILISWFGAKLIISTGMTEFTTGELMTMLTYSIQILSSLMMLSIVLVIITISKASAERIVEVLDEVPDIKSPKKPIRKVENGSIEFKNVGFSYVKDKKKESLKKINLKIKSGETIGIIGGTGSGKSSLVNLIPRLYDATEGEVLVAGINVKKYDLNALRNEVACVLQKNVLFSGTVSDNIRWGKENATDEEVRKVCKLAQADEFISGFPDGYNTYIEEGGTNVSGGQKQRLCIARALLKHPKIIIFDDSTSAVDTKTDSLIRKALANDIPDTTKIIIAQRISSVEDCDKIIVMNNGEIDAIGTHEELLKNNTIYQEVYESQVKGSDTNE